MIPEPTTPLTQLQVSPDWRSLLAAWSDADREQHRVVTERLASVGWNEDAAAFVAYERLREVKGLA